MQKFSVSGGMGSALLSDPDRACRIIRALTNEMTSSAYNPIPVSGKIRLLDTVSSTVDFATALIQAGAKAIAIHGRRPGDLDIRPADWTTLETSVSILTQKFPTTPILINGDFYTRDEFTGFCDRTGAAGVLLARPALYNLSLFRKPHIVDSNNNNSISPQFGYTSPLLLSRTNVIQDYVRESVRYDAYFKNVKYVVSEMMTNRRTPTERVQHMPNVFPAGQTVAQVCQISSLQQMCKLWDVNYDSSSSALRANGDGVGDGRAYSDEYLLRAEADDHTEGQCSNDLDQINTLPTPKKRRVESSNSEAGPDALN
jgi:tRNA-dihydrouridine synthase